jgi:DNA-binding response OmpR family regulator
MKKILIIEDDQKIARALKIRFESNGYETVMASDAILGANLALQAKPDLIILDIGLPDGNGLQLAEKFQGQPETQYTPIIFVTASKDPNLRRRAMEMRIAGLFDKPYDPEELLASVRYALGEVVPLPPRQLSAAAHPKPDHRPPKKILIVEDDRNIAKALEVRLNALGYQAILAYDALSGLNMAIHSSPDLVLLDISLPAGSGIAVAEKIQTLLPRQTPIIFLTASKQREYRTRAQELGAAGFFEKPYDPDELLAAIRQALRESTPVRLADPHSSHTDSHEHSRR